MTRAQVPAAGAASGPGQPAETGWPGVPALAAFYIGYLCAVAFGRWMMVIPDIPITVWPPNGVILAMLLTRPRHSWPIWLGLGALGELTGNLLWFHNPLDWALGYVAANAAGVTLAALLLSTYLTLPIRRLATLPQVLAFLAVGVLGAPSISATLGSAIDALVGKNPFAVTWPIWWLGDATGILIATPLAICAINAWREQARPTVWEVVEGGGILLVIFALTAWEIVTGGAHAYLLPLPILWAALRFEFRGASLAVLGLALAIGVQAQTFDPAQLSAATIALLHTRMQGVIVVAAATGLIVAAIIRQQRQAVAELARTNQALEERVVERTRAIEAAEQRFRATFHNAGVGIGIVSGDGRLLRVNDSLAGMLGYTPAEMEDLPLDSFTHPDDRAGGEAARARLNSGAAEEYELEKRYLRRDGGHVWGQTTVSCVRHPDGSVAYLIKIIQDITARKRSDESRQMLMREVNHRSKNLLSIVQVIARQTAARSPQAFVDTFGQRLRALAANQDLLVNSAWQRVELDALVRGQLEHFADIGSRVLLSGPSVMVPPAAAQALGLALHELATNAAKYGSLSTETGRVQIGWAVEGERFRMTWRESGGPPVSRPQATGFGTTVLDRMTAASMGGEVSIDYAPEGLVWQLDCPVSAFSETVESEFFL